MNEVFRWECDADEERDREIPLAARAKIDARARGGAAEEGEAGEGGGGGGEGQEDLAPPDRADAADDDGEDAGALRRASLQEFHDDGMLWVANRALHPFGYALSLAVAVEEGEGYDAESAAVVEDAGLRVLRSGDPLGIVFSETEEDHARRRFFRALGDRELP